MSTVRLRRQHEFHPEDPTAPAPVRRPKRNALIKRHWLSGALFCILAGLTVYSGKSFMETEKQLKEVRARAAQLDAELELKQRQSRALDDKLEQINSDQYLEYLAKTMGYVHPNETVYQKGSGKGN